MPADLGGARQRAVDALYALGCFALDCAPQQGLSPNDLAALSVGAVLDERACEAVRADNTPPRLGDISFDLTTGHKSPRPPKCHKMYASNGGSVAKLQGTGKPGPGGGGKRGAAGFSARSRKRLLQTIGAIDKRHSEPPLFVGLTYPGVWPEDPARPARDLEQFYRRLCRRFPALRIAVLWRKEPQKRGAPHFHLFVFGIPFLRWQWVAATWAELTGGNAATCSRVEKVRSWRGAMSYASKYLAKRDEDSGACGFTTPSGEPLAEVGRHWGVMGRRYLPVSWVCYVLIAPQFHWLRRQIGRYLRAKGRQQAVRSRHAGMWCFMPAEDVGRLMALVAPYAIQTAEPPRL